MVVLFSFGAQAQVQVGSGTNTSQHLPIYAYYGYTYSQQIYLASEINASGTITQLKFYFNGSTLSNSNNWTIYIGTTTKTSFSSTSDWIATSSLTQVYSGTFTDPGAAGWITFDITDWAYNGTDNIVVAVDENASSYNGSSDKFYCTSVTGDRSIEYHNDNTNPDPANPPTASATAAYIPNIIFDGISQACPDPSAQTEANITTSGADLGWTDASGSHWDIYVTTSGGAAPVQGTTPTANDVTASPYTYSSGSQATTYDWYVRSDCNQDNITTSTWVGPSSFTTLQTQAPAQSLPFTEDWESNSLHIGTIWNTDKGSVATIQTSTASKNGGTYGLEQYGNSSSSYSTPSGLADAKTKAESGGANENWTSWNKFSVDLTSASNPWLSFYYAMGYQYNDNYNNFWVQVSTNGTTWTDLFSSQTNGAAVPFTKKDIDLSSYNGNAQVFIRFFHNGKYNTNYLYLDDISVEEVTCPDPTAQTEANITTSGADLGWTDASGSHWDIYVTTSGGAAPVQGTTPTANDVTANPYTYSGGSAATSYDWYVRSDCNQDNVGTSAWVGPSTFTTQCNSVSSFPYTEDFSSWSPSCWETDHVTTGSTDDWDQNSNAARANFYSQSSGKTDIMISPTFDVSGLTTPSLDFKWSHKLYASGNKDSLSVEITDNGGTSWHQVWTKGGSNLESNDGAGNTAPGSYVSSGDIDLSAYGNSIQIRFYATSDYGADLFVDDFRIREMPTCPDPTAQTEANITTSGADLGWTDASGAHWDIYVTTSGGAAPTQSTTPTANDVTANPYTYSGGSSNTTYDWYVRSDCDQDNIGTSTWVGPSSFTTTALAPACATSPTPADAATGVTANTVTLSWTAPVDDATHDSATSYDVYFGTTSGSLTLQGNTSNTSYDVSAFVDLTTYYWQIIPKNSAGSATGCPEWSFTTALTQSATTQNAPWSDDFSTHSSGMGTTTNGWLTTPSTGFAWDVSTSGTTPSSNTGPSADNSGDDHFIYTEASSGSQGSVAVLYSPKLDLSALTTPELSFYYHMYGASMGDLHIDVYNGTAYTNDVATALSGQQQSAQGDAWLKYTVDLSSYSGTIHIRFRGVRGSSYTGDMSIDDFSIHEAPSCPDPTLQTATNLTVNGADLGWTDASGSHWDIYVTSSGGAAPVQGTTPTANDVTTNPYSYTGGSASTTYEWYVRSDCDQDNVGTSAWVGPHSFTTSDGKAVNPTPADNSTTVAISSTTLDWDDVANATGYHISVGTTSGGTDIVNNVAISGGTNSTYTVSSNWLFNQDYYWTVTSDFSGSSVTGDEWSFMTVDGKATNPTPSNGATGILVSSKTLDWDDVADATGYHISVGTTSGGTDVVNNASCGSTSSYTVSSNWSYGTTYYWTITTDYSGGTVTGDEWSFTTECGTYTPTYSQDFTSYVPNCWSETKGELETSTTHSGTTSNWTSDGFANNGSTGSARMNIYGTNKFEWLISPSIDLSGAGYQLEFDIALTPYSGTGTASLDVDDSVVVVISTDNGATWSKTNALRTWANGDAISNGSGDHIIIDLSSYNTTVKIGFYATSTVSNSDINVYIDNFIVQIPPACPAPTAQTEANITTSGADLGWTDASGSHWDIYVTSSGGTAPVQGTTPTANDITSNPYTYSGGSAYTTYDWYVRSDCDQDNVGTSTWTGPHSFTTSKVSSSTLAGKTSKCSPQFVRPNGGTPPSTQSSNTVFYDKFSITVPTTGTYDILSDQDYDGYLHIYENSFDPANPMTNVIGGDDDNNNGNGAAHGSKIEGLTLNSGTTYIIVGSGYSSTGIGTISFWLEGASAATMPASTDHYGYPYRSYTVPSTDGTSRTSDYECDDANDWTTYYDDNGTSSDYTDDNLLFAIKKNGNNLGTTTVTIDGASGASFIPTSSSFSKYVNSFQGWYVFNRYWNVNAATQPTTDVDIRFYYKDADFIDLNDSLSNAGRTTIANREDMSALKINDLNSSGYDPNPANGHNNIPKATTYDADGAWIYNPPASPTTVTNAKWTAGDYNSDHYFEYTVKHFSGGGGGAAGNTLDGTLPIELLSFDAFANGDINQVVWKTASEYNVERFVVERMNPVTKKIEEIGSVKAVGNSNEIQSYSFDDKNPLDEGYYRIRNIDYDGASETFDWVFVKRSAKEFKLINLYPNPAQNIAHVELVNPTDNSVHIELRDMVGKVILSKAYEAKDGLQSINLDLSSISAGTYYISIDNTKDRIIKLLIIK